MDVRSERWYLSREPWYQGEAIGTLILAGGEDPHTAAIVADMTPMDSFEHIYDAETHDGFIKDARLTAQRIVELHNVALKQSQQNIKEQSNDS